MLKDRVTFTIRSGAGARGSMAVNLKHADGGDGNITSKLEAKDQALEQADVEPVTKAVKKAPTKKKAVAVKKAPAKKAPAKKKAAQKNS